MPENQYKFEDVMLFSLTFAAIVGIVAFCVGHYMASHGMPYGGAPC